MERYFVTKHFYYEEKMGFNYYCTEVVNRPAIVALNILALISSVVDKECCKPFQNPTLAIMIFKKFYDWKHKPGV